MKTILVPTDFSACADNAAHYALQLGEVLKADIKLCNAIMVPAESALANTVVWPLEDYASLKESVTSTLETACEKLRREEQDNLGNHTFPRVEFTSQVGDVTHVVKNLVDEWKIPLVVMGLSGAGAMSKFFLGSNSEHLIENAYFPLLLIPAGVTYKKIRKIAFATDFNPHDLEIVYSLVAFAINFNAEILIAHITDEKYDSAEHTTTRDAFLSQVTCKANYDKIYYRHIASNDVQEGLNWICEQSLSDMIVMSHGKHNLLDSFFNGSQTKKLARHANIPLMVYPKEVRNAALIAF